MCDVYCLCADDLYIKGGYPILGRPDVLFVRPYVGFTTGRVESSQVVKPNHTAILSIWLHERYRKYGALRPAPLQSLCYRKSRSSLLATIYPDLKSGRIRSDLVNCHP